MYVERRKCIAPHFGTDWRHWLTQRHDAHDTIAQAVLSEMLRPHKLHVGQQCAKPPSCSSVTDLLHGEFERTLSELGATGNLARVAYLNHNYCCLQIYYQRTVNELSTTMCASGSQLVTRAFCVPRTWTQCVRATCTCQAVRFVFFGIVNHAHVRVYTCETNIYMAPATSKRRRKACWVLLTMSNTLTATIIMST